MFVTVFCLTTLGSVKIVITMYRNSCFFVLWPVRQYDKLTKILAAFAIMQGIDHLVGALGFGLLAKGLLERLSFGILLLFGVIYLVNKSKVKEEVKEEVKEILVLFPSLYPDGRSSDTQMLLSCLV